MKIHKVLAKRVAANVVRLRAEGKLSQRDLASKAGMSQPHIQMIEQGDRNPSLESVERLAIALGVLPTSLFKEDV